MFAVLFRILLLTAGMAAIEVGLGTALVNGSLLGWGLALLAGVPLTVAGSAGFIGPLLGGPQQKETAPDA